MNPNPNFDWTQVHYTGKFIDGLGIIYLFDADMNELGYHVGDNRVFTHAAGRHWPQSSINKLDLTKIAIKLSINIQS